ncbi:hypothetical protein CAPTEDRAFT_195934 [Capitella teleta]|uniref:Uncharacterized protein n=1 Tax=Capitella teleta TaxID=283909 RepID=R7UMG6_CAPTE|nr:hypothetical protein CAPTEDRAFT_195934 [Capitella teleta]|eukprot:ELU07298.1 hypothetical protein CAPTEDRAFT_195934 [Capitella teleta]
MQELAPAQQRGVTTQACGVPEGARDRIGIPYRVVNLESLSLRFEMNRTGPVPVNSVSNGIIAASGMHLPPLEPEKVAEAKIAPKISLSGVAGITRLLKGVGHRKNTSQGGGACSAQETATVKPNPQKKMVTGDTCRIEDSPFRIMKVLRCVANSFHSVNL